MKTDTKLSSLEVKHLI